MVSRRRPVVFALIAAAAALVVGAVGYVATAAYAVGRYVRDFLSPFAPAGHALAKTYHQAPAELPGEKSRVMAMEAGRVELCRKHERWTACPST